MDGGSRVAAVLADRGVQTLFALCGGNISPILVECNRRGIRVVDTRHEVNAVFAADATARLTGRPGVAAVTAGPGVTNAMTAVKNAALAQSPIVLIGGATATLARGRGSLQDIDQVSLMKPHVKWLARPNNMREVVPAMERAFQEAQSGVPGPVFVELAVDLLYAESVVREQLAPRIEESARLRDHAVSAVIRGHLRYLFTEPFGPSFHDPEPPAIEEPSSKDVRAARKMVERARRPVLVIGSQTMLHPGRTDALVRAIEQIGAPVYLSGMARGLLGEHHPLLLRHKRKQALRQADVVVLSGLPCDFRLDYGSHVAGSKVIGVNLSETDLRKNRRPDLGLLADPMSFLLALGERPLDAGSEEWSSLLRVRDEEREAEITGMANESVEYVNPLALCRAIDQHLTEDSVLVGDGGDFVATAAYTIHPRGPLSWLDPGVFGTLGVGAGFAMAAKLHRPSSDVWLLYGDGSAGFSIMELDTLARHSIPIIAVVGNDAGWTQIAREQEPMLGDDIGTRLTHMDYHEVAEACGGHGICVTKWDQLEEALEEAKTVSRSGSPVLINVLIGRTAFRKGAISM